MPFSNVLKQETWEKWLAVESFDRDQSVEQSTLSIKWEESKEN